MIARLWACFFLSFLVAPGETRKRKKKKKKKQRKKSAGRHRFSRHLYRSLPEKAVFAPHSPIFYFSHTRTIRVGIFCQFQFPTFSPSLFVVCLIQILQQLNSSTLFALHMSKHRKRPARHPSQHHQPQRNPCPRQNHQKIISSSSFFLTDQNSQIEHKRSLSRRVAGRECPCAAQLSSIRGRSVARNTPP